MARRRGPAPLSAKGTGWIAACIAVAAVLIATAPLIDAGRLALIESGAFRDNAFFYSVIADRVADGGPISLDGLHPTNGFQPLWMALLVLLELIFRPADSFSLVIWAGYSLTALAAALFARYLMAGGSDDILFPGPASPAAGAGSGAAAAATALFMLLTFAYPPFLTKMLSGLETPLLLVILGLWLVAARHALAPEAGIRETFWLSVASAALFLARTDLFWAPLLATLITFARFGFGRALWINLALSALLILPYLTWNIVSFDALVPISGRVKIFHLREYLPTAEAYWASNEWRAFPSLFAELYNIGLVPLALLLAALVLGFAGRSVRAFLPREVWLLAVICALHLIYMQLAYRVLPASVNYYFIPELVLLLLVAAHLVRSALIRVRPALATGNAAGMLGAAAVVLALAAIGPMTAPQPDPDWTARLTMADDIARIVPEDEAVGAFEPGLFAQYAQRTIVPLNGVISSEPFFEDIVRTRREIAYAQEIGLSYLVVYYPAGYVESGAIAPTVNWTQFYLERLQDSGDLTADEVISRGSGQRGAGWYLLRLDRVAG